MDNHEEVAEARTPSVGEAVVFHDPVGKAHPALVTAVWSPTCINILYVSSDDSKKDSYGRQVERSTSLVHKNNMSGVHGNYWRFENEVPNSYKEPLGV